MNQFKILYLHRFGFYDVEQSVVKKLRNRMRKILQIPQQEVGHYNNNQGLTYLYLYCTCMHYEHIPIVFDLKQ